MDPARPSGLDLVRPPRARHVRSPLVARLVSGVDARREPAGERVADPAERLERARALAWRALDRRDRTELELRRILAEKRVAPEEAGVVVGELIASGFVDDAAFAERFADDRRRLDAWGAERIERRLRALGVAPEHVAAALAEQDHGAEVEAALGLLHRRVPAVPRTARERDRALGMLLRKGYELELARDALRRFAGADELF
jgi:regulatory protein